MNLMGESMQSDYHIYQQSRTNQVGETSGLFRVGLLNVLVPLILGAGVYLIVKGQSLYLGPWEIQAISSLPVGNSLLGSFLLDHGADFLWMYSFSWSFLVVFRPLSWRVVHYTLVPLAPAVMLEYLLPAYNLGTYDPYDILTYGLASLVSAIAYLIIHHFFKTCNYEKD